MRLSGLDARDDAPKPVGSMDPPRALHLLPTHEGAFTHPALEQPGCRHQQRPTGNNHQYRGQHNEYEGQQTSPGSGLLGRRGCTINAQEEKPGEDR